MSTSRLTGELIERVLAAAPRLTIGVLGDLYLDRYLDLDAGLTEPSIETGLDAYQVVRVRACPGAAGTVINNLVSLGVGRVCPLAVIGDDGEGLELCRALAALRGVGAAGVLSRADRRTPTYTKPMLHEPGGPARELNRLDIHNRAPLPAETERELLDRLGALWGELDGLVVLDQVRLPDCGVVTAGARRWLAERARGGPRPPVLADSRERIGLFQGVGLKPNARECLAAVGAGEGELTAAARALAERAGSAVYCTRGEQGVLLAAPGGAVEEVPGFAVTGPTDPVGAGDSTSAGIICALAAGTSPAEAAAFGCLVASVTVSQIGTTGTASPEQVRARWREVAATRLHPSAPSG
jgi:bifunctional ADP-heptose synthase (sugar kinase/adenylyltransferase)